MNAKTRREIEKRINQLNNPTDEQIHILLERVKRYKETHGTLENQGIFKRLVKHFL